MIGYVTVGSNDLEQGAQFLRNLMAIGASRIMEFGDNFTMYGTGMGKPGFAVCKPHDGNAATAGNGKWRRSPATAEPRSTRYTRRRWSWAANAKARRASAAKRAIRLSTVPISVTSTGTSSPPSASARRNPPECPRPSSSTAAAARSRPTPTSPARSTRR